MFFSLQILICRGLTQLVEECKKGRLNKPETPIGYCQVVTLLILKITYIPNAIFLSLINVDKQLLTQSPATGSLCLQQVFATQP